MLFGGGRGWREMLTGKARSHCYLRFPAECQERQKTQLRRVGGGGKLEGEQFTSQDLRISLGFLALLLLSPGKEWSRWGEQAASPAPPPPTFIVAAQGWSARL